MAQKELVKKEAPKKAAKKMVGKHDPNKAAKDARRTFEHLGRVQVISRLTKTEEETLSVLASLSDQAFQGEHYKESADLMRAAEHLSFAALHAGAQENVASNLQVAIKEEIAHLAEKAKEHSAKHPLPKEIKPLVQRFTRDAKQSFQQGSYRAALEFARGAEALAHVHMVGEKVLPPSAPQARLRG